MTNEEKWNAVATNNAGYDGKFYYAVKSTGIYCRPSCKSKLPDPANILYFDTKTDAENAGYRPCKRCRPDLIDYQPVQNLARQMKQIIDSEFLDKAHVFQELKKLGVTPKRSIEIFKEQFGVTPGAYADRLRMNEARCRLSESDMPILEIAYTLGFESISAFYSFFGRYTDMTPGEFRRNAQISSGMEAEAETSFVYPAALGTITITADRDAITGIRFGEPVMPFKYGRNILTDMAAEQLAEYFSGTRSAFTVPLRPAGSSFQQSVWSALRDIPYGKTNSYKQIAERIGRPTASRAVGMANNRNPILIMIPCHRVVGADGSLVGYAAGLPIKQRLLALEREIFNHSA